MKSDISVDFISDLDLDESSEFSWENKPTSLFCLVGGGISSSLAKVEEVLTCLSKEYRGVFYIDGATEHPNISEYHDTVSKLKKICDKFTNVVYLHNHVVVLNKVAFIACNGWFRNYKTETYNNHADLINRYRIDDISYLCTTITTLQNHNDAKKIVVLTSSIPSEQLLYSSDVHAGIELINPAAALMKDKNDKIKIWAFGGSTLSVDANLTNRRFVNNPCISGMPYWPKRIEI
jgi:hypothetical protein